MIGVLRILIFWILATGAIIFIIYHISAFLLGTDSVRARLNRDWKLLKRQIDEFLDGLVPFTTQEFKLLSASPIKKVSRKGLSVIEKGYLSTIYQEALFAYAIKNFPGKDQAIMLVRSKSHVYKFHFKGLDTLLFLDGQAYGFIDEKSVLWNPEGDQEIARIDIAAGGKYAQVQAHGQELAHLNMKDYDGSPISERAFSVFHDFVEQDSDKLCFLALHQLLLLPFIDDE